VELAGQPEQARRPPQTPWESLTVPSPAGHSSTVTMVTQYGTQSHLWGANYLPIPAWLRESWVGPNDSVHEFDSNHRQERIRDRVECFHALDYLGAAGSNTDHVSTQPRVS
jgi:hypothetical protein